VKGHDSRIALLHGFHISLEGGFGEAMEAVGGFSEGGDYQQTGLLNARLR
jgi:hypothetical protein